MTVAARTVGGQARQPQNTAPTRNARNENANNMKTKHSGNSGKIETLKNAILAAINATGLKGAGEVSSTTLKTVRKAFTKSIHGVMVVAKEPEAALFSSN